MEMRLTKDVVLRPSAVCTVRRQEEQYLFYNTVTDELYLMPPTGYYVFQLCDAVTTVGQLHERLTIAFPEPPEDVEGKLNEFLGSLLDRGLLELESNETKG